MLLMTATESEPPGITMGSQATAGYDFGASVVVVVELVVVEVVVLGVVVVVVLDVEVVGFNFYLMKRLSL